MLGRVVGFTIVLIASAAVGAGIAYIPTVIRYAIALAGSDKCRLMGDGDWGIFNMVVTLSVTFAVIFLINNRNRISVYASERLLKSRVKTALIMTGIVFAFVAVYRSSDYYVFCTLVTSGALTEETIPAYQGRLSSIFIFWAALISTVVIWLDILTLRFRVRRGQFGYNAMEAKELISFLMKEGERPGKGPPWMALPPEPERQKSSLPLAQVEGSRG